ncbi:MAG: imidazole glycerol phosphate synthase subunit HisH [Proteobacteria bacterium]|nr:imidazole glycerol phosphate synthase subunit HisH [Pseudomonadota bacterium]
MIAIIEGCGTNIASIEYALARLNKVYCVTSDPKVIKQASHVIIPGVSTAQRALAQLQRQALTETILSLKQPVLGICSGMQILFDWCEEGQVKGLGIFSGKVVKLPEKVQTIPHMGWNKLIQNLPTHSLLQGIAKEDDVYFVHSFAASISQDTIASCDYGISFSAIVAKDNFYGTQFHPEKSGKVGLRLLANFCQ